MLGNKIYKVFVSSTYEDLRDERSGVQKALLKLGCLPVGMEIFPAADTETWEFIQGQIRGSDYYVLIVAGKYGSLAPGGLSFTEREYDYAREIGKPSIGFVHEDRGAIPSARVESDPKRVAMLDRFLNKIKTRPVRQYNTSHQLAMEVTVSFVDLITRQPAIGFVRANEAADPIKYADALETIQQLQRRIAELERNKAPELFSEHAIETPITFNVFKRERTTGALRTVRIATKDASISWGNLIKIISEKIPFRPDEFSISLDIAEAVVATDDAAHGGDYCQLSDQSLGSIRSYLYSAGFIETSMQSGVLTWTFTPFGREQLRLLSVGPPRLPAGD